MKYNFMSMILFAILLSSCSPSTSISPSSIKKPSLNKEINFTILHDTSQLSLFIWDYQSPWIPDTNNLIEVEEILIQAIETEHQESWERLSVKSLPTYCRQYVGYVDSKGDSLIHVNAFYCKNEPPKDFLDWKKGYFIVLDGGDNYWSISINLKTGSYQHFMVNGHA